LTTRGHIRLLLIATLVWAAFLSCGLPSYYQQYSTRFMLGFDIVVLVPMVALMLDRRGSRASRYGAA
jgi:low temperature requirement protein LtrA